VFLKQLQIKGFKSFADSTTLVMEPGVTVVVGPNGSGKSNVVDAIGWVLGAQRPSAVRSQKMDDVIFAGTQRRAALGRAEVTLTIDNSAGLLPVDFTEINICRILFRNGDSEYSINGVPCRLLDVTELLSDAGVGRQQHVIISQGQIDAVLNSKAEDRRSIIEEAAGVLKYRKRKERSERRLLSTEANLTRLNDLLREVRRQLRPLEKQADAARRHGEVVAELHSAKLFVTGRALRRIQDQLTRSAEEQRRLAAEQTTLRSTLADLDARVLATEAEMTALGATDRSEMLTRYEALHQRARGATALLAERRRNLDRERTAFVGEGVVEGLEAEQAQLTAELAEVGQDAERMLVSEADFRRAESELASARITFTETWGDGVPSPDVALSETRAELAALRNSADRNQADLRRLGDQRSSLRARAESRRAELASMTSELAERSGALGGLVEAADGALREAEEAEESQRSAEDAARAAGEERSRWEARADALDQALDAARQRAGAQRVQAVEGVLGTLLDIVDVDSGWEAAFEAAAGDALGAVVLDRDSVAAEVLDLLTRDGGAGAVLMLAAQTTPAAVLVGEPIRSHVRSRRPDRDGALDEALDALIGHVGVVEGTWKQAIDIALANPAATVVTRGGDRFSPTGWRVGGSATAATGAALDQARSAAASASEADQAAQTGLAAARERLAQARTAHRERASQLAEAERREQRLHDEIGRAEQTVAEIDAELVSLDAHAQLVDERTEREQLRSAELAESLSALELAETERDEQVQRMRVDQHRVEQLAVAVAALRNDLEVKAAALEERRRLLSSRLRGVTERLERHRAEAIAAGERRIEMEARSLATERLHAFVERRLTLIASDLEAVREERRRQSEAAKTVIARLEELRRRRVEAERGLESNREAHHRAEVADTEARLRLETLTELCRNDLNCEPSDAMAAPEPPLPSGVTATERVRELERELRLMGPINPLALTEFAELSERHEFLTAQLDDVKQSRRELNKVISAIDEEIVSVFAAAYSDVANNFAYLFDTLFPGGKGKLHLTDPADLLNTGIEVEASPSGKNVKKLSLLSGGERSLVALAFLFAVFRSRPSPFYVMDEVEAALDDVNLHRFLGLVAEFRSAAQLIIVSHQKRTMEAADVLYGVTMEPGGSSKGVSQKIGA
jgi:chromosome segregation protein